MNSHDRGELDGGCAVWALDHLLEHEGSAYLPERLAAPHLAAERLHRVDDAPVFSRATYLITNEAAGLDWKWLLDLVEDLATTPSTQ